MPNNQNRPYLLSNILGVIVAAYTLSNLLFITWCVPKMQAAERGAVCSFAEPLRILETNIPVIYRPVRFLKDSNNLGRADAVSLAYSFSWASALIAFIVMIPITLAAIVYVDYNIKTEFEQYIESQRRKSGNLSLYRTVTTGTVVIFSAATLAFLDAFYGDFQFGGFSEYSNMVHIRDRDFYRPSIDLTILLLCLMFGLAANAKYFALRRKIDK